MSFMYTIICKTQWCKDSRPNRLRVATFFFGNVPGASVFTRFADRAKKQASIFLGVLKREEEILLRRYDAKIWCEGMMRRYDAKVRRSEDPQRKLSGKKALYVQGSPLYGLACTVACTGGLYAALFFVCSSFFFRLDVFLSPRAHFT